MRDDMEHLLVEQDGACLVLTLNRPEKLNALTVEVIDRLASEFIRADEDPDKRSILLTGAGSAFCVGQDLARRDPDGPDWPPDLHASVTQHYGPLISAILNCRKPVICAVNGVAAGAGANLALACDIVLAAESARFIQSFGKVGLIPDSGGTWILPRLIGLARARAICLTGEPIAASRAEQWGMIWRAVPDSELANEARDTARELGSGATVALGLAKSALLDSGESTFEDQLAREADAQKAAGRTADYAEGVRAFLAKRPPRFEGR